MSELRASQALRAGQDHSLFVVFDKPRIDARDPDLMKKLAQGAKIEANAGPSARRAAGASRLARIAGTAGAVLDAYSLVVVVGDSISFYSCTGDTLETLDRSAQGVGGLAASNAGAETGGEIGLMSCLGFGPAIAVKCNNADPHGAL